MVGHRTKRLLVPSLLSVLGLLGGLVERASGIPTISVKGSKFFNSDGQQFFIKGIAYGNNNDLNSLTNAEQCKIDAALMKDAGANTIRVYTVDPTLNHTACMNTFAEAGIYVFVSLTSSDFAINRNTPTWTKEIRNRFGQVIDAFQQYDNTIGFFMGDEVVSDTRTTNTAYYIKAAARDMKAYRDFMGYRKIPIGYSSSNVTTILPTIKSYLTCEVSNSFGNTEADDPSIDFFAYNIYTWCSANNNMQTTGYQDLLNQNTSPASPIPIFFAETGCNEVHPRTFSDMSAILGSKMNDVLSGAIAYEWVQEVNDYGLASYSAKDQYSVPTGTPKLLPDYTSLKSVWATLSPAGIKSAAYTPSLSVPPCPTFKSATWEVSAKAVLPTLGTSGLTAPETPRTTTTVPKTGSAATTQASATEAKVPTNGNTGNNGETGEDKKKRSRAGPIAGGIIAGAIVGGAIGFLVFWLRRRAQRRPKHGMAQLNDGDSMGTLKDSDKHVLAVNDVYVDGASDSHGSNGGLSELPAQQRTAELSTKTGWRNEMPGNKGQGSDVELPDDRVVNGEYYGHATSEPPSPNEDQNEHPTPESESDPPRASAEPSPFVQAQRQLELNWLESEEAKIKERRARLMAGER